MGDREILEITCPKCGQEDDDVYFAPTCGFDDWECPGCGYVLDLCKHTGISYEDASNEAEMRRIVKDALDLT